MLIYGVAMTLYVTDHMIQVTGVRWVVCLIWAVLIENSA